jgi:hypothetical protein
MSDKIDKLTLFNIMIENFENINTQLNYTQPFLLRIIKKWKGAIDLNDCFKLADRLNYKYASNLRLYSQYINFIFTTYAIYCRINKLKVKPIKNKDFLFKYIKDNIDKDWLDLSDDLFLQLKKESV